MIQVVKPVPRTCFMNKQPNDRRQRALEALVARYEQSTTNNQGIFLSENEYEELLFHYYNGGDFDRTLEVADHGIAQYSFTPEFYKWKALIHKINLEEEEALAALEKLATYAPNDEEVMILRLEVLTHFDQQEPARQLLDQLFTIVEDRDKQSTLAFFEGLLYLQAGEIPEAFDALRESVRLDPYQEPAYDELLNAEEFVLLREGVGKLLRWVVNRDPFNDLAWYYLGLWYDDGGDDLSALEAFGNARSLNTDRGSYDLEYADKLFDLERYELALKAYAAYQQSEEAEDNYETAIRVGRCHQLLGNLERAKIYFFRAAEFAPDMYDTYQHLGECFVAEEKWGMAAYNYGRAVEQPGHTSDCWLGLALCSSATNQPVEAEAAFVRALEMEPRFSDAVVSYALFLVDQGREMDAMLQINEALGAYEDASLLYGAAAIHLLINRRRTALEYLNDALASYYDDRFILLDWYPHLVEDTDVQALVSLHAPEPGQ